ncbi:hypothetical protein C8035_v003940 [Colletotrichum spinosum]|uniref:C2H2-type domain-containing protein n=1 Tax=Colletotrichum spinosum TaxID=1347390 RepID=A0A4R8PT66_9PEZI|nr:hypothetical protein C8035_v003940 [Colletotrichum spinosum]
MVDFRVVTGHSPREWLPHRAKSRDPNSQIRAISSFVERATVLSRILGRLGRRNICCAPDLRMAKGHRKESGRGKCECPTDHQDQTKPSLLLEEKPPDNLSWPWEPPPMVAKDPAKDEAIFAERKDQSGSSEWNHRIKPIKQEISPVFNAVPVTKTPCGEPEANEEHSGEAAYSESISYHKPLRESLHFVWEGDRISHRGSITDASQQKPSRSNTAPVGAGQSGRVSKQSAKRRDTIPPRKTTENAQTHVKPSVPDEENQRFACPYFKLDRSKHIDCLHFQLKRVKDVKQHIFRKHPFHCPNCFIIFPSGDRCTLHMKNGGCEANAHCRDEAKKRSISEEQKIRLYSRMTHCKSEREQWYAIWSILFPHEPKPESPLLGTILEETILTARHAYVTNRSRVFSGLSATVRMGDGGPPNPGRITNLPRNALAQPDSRNAVVGVESALDELARVVANRGSDPIELSSCNEQPEVKPDTSLNGDEVSLEEYQLDSMVIFSGLESWGPEGLTLEQPMDPFPTSLSSGVWPEPPFDALEQHTLGDYTRDQESSNLDLLFDSAITTWPVLGTGSGDTESSHKYS